MPGEFPSVPHQFKKGASGFQGRVKPVIGRRRAHAMRVAILKAAAVRGAPEPFEGDALALLQRTYRDVTLPLDVRLSAANAALKAEKPTQEPDQPALDPAQRRERLAALLGKIDGGAELAKRLAPPVTIEPDAVDVERQARLQALAAEKKWLLAELAKAEQAAAIRRAASGTGFSLPSPNAHALHNQAWDAHQAAREERERQWTRYNGVARAIEKLR